MSETYTDQKKYEVEQEQFAHNQIINEILNKRLDSAGDIDPNTEILTLRCQGTNCKKILGKVNAQRQLITESSRSGSWIKTIMEKGFVKCKKCGNLLSWDSQKLNRREK